MRVVERLLMGEHFRFNLADLLVRVDVLGVVEVVPGRVDGEPPLIPDAPHDEVPAVPDRLIGIGRVESRRATSACHRRSFAAVIVPRSTGSPPSARMTWISSSGLPRAFWSKLISPP
jgi:hypothetical protein